MCDLNSYLNKELEHVNFLLSKEDIVKKNKEIIGLLRKYVHESNHTDKKIFIDFLEKIEGKNTLTAPRLSLSYINKTLKKIEADKEKLFGDLCDILDIYIKNSQFFMLLYYHKHRHYTEEIYASKYKTDIYEKNIDMNKIYDYTRCFTNVRILSSLLDNDINMSGPRINLFKWTNGLDSIIRLIRESTDDMYYINCGFPQNNSQTSSPIYKPLDGPDHIMMIFKYNNQQGCPKYVIIQSYVRQYCPRLKIYSQEEIIQAIRELNGIFYNKIGNPIYHTKLYYTDEDNQIYQKYIFAPLTRSQTLCALTIYPASIILGHINHLLNEVYPGYVPKDENKLKEKILLIFCQGISGKDISNSKIMSSILADVITGINEHITYKNTNYNWNNYQAIADNSIHTKQLIQNLVLYNNNYNVGEYKYKTFTGGCYEFLSNNLNDPKIKKYISMMKQLVEKYNPSNSKMTDIIKNKILKKVKFATEFNDLYMFLLDQGALSPNGIEYYFGPHEQSFISTYDRLQKHIQENCKGSYCSMKLTGGQKQAVLNYHVNTKNKSHQHSSQSSNAIDPYYQKYIHYKKKYLSEKHK